MGKEITPLELKHSLRHYWRMRQWARQQRNLKRSFYAKMVQDISESWLSNDCILCRHHRGYSCKTKCPLSLNGHNCQDDDSVWSQLSASLNTYQFAINATRMARIIMKLPRRK